jgi:hypothetical protein
VTRRLSNGALMNRTSSHPSPTFYDEKACVDTSALYCDSCAPARVHFDA